MLYVKTSLAARPAQIGDDGSSPRTVRDLRRRNRSALLSKLYFDGPLSRQELSQLHRAERRTVSNVVGELIEEGLVVEAGLVDSDGGRPRVLLRVDPATATWSASTSARPGSRSSCSTWP